MSAEGSRAEEKLAAAAEAELEFKVDGCDAAMASDSWRTRNTTRIERPDCAAPRDGRGLTGGDAAARD